MSMPNIDYPQVISETQKELEKLEKRHRYPHLFHRVRMLGLLKSEEYSALGEAAKSLEATAGARARDGSPPTRRGAWRRCSRAGSTSVAGASWSARRRSRNSGRR